ncbi:Chaoptic protein [Danaus plexippus plexippus]|uniref:Chaoptic protein n=1 Tax=Danaus plexippus plexippus TaxID=278856 RepID=A0A212ET41_DANPL|nr:Chaoptic protein [Danaus plexippus plexippus]
MNQASVCCSRSAEVTGVWTELVFVPACGAMRGSCRPRLCFASSAALFRFLTLLYCITPVRRAAQLQFAALLVLLVSATARAPRPCAASPLCVCRDDHFACDAVPFHRFPETETGVLHVSISAARLGVLGEAALDGRPLRTLVLVASRLHQVDGAALASMATSLASLDMSYNEFTEVPIEALRHLKVLNWLNLQNNFISDLNSVMDWGGLTDSLSSLSLSNNHICVISQGVFSSLRHLTQLELDGNRLRQLDAEALPISLAILRLSDNLLSGLPCRALTHLPRLRHLHLRNNILQPKFNITCRSERSKIDSLDLSHNELSDGFNFDFHHSIQLKQLVLDLNDFTAVPAFVLECGRLEKLSISYNNLQHVSDTIVHGLKHSLQRFDLDHNELTLLPDSLREMNRLRHLSVTYNRLEDIKHLPPKLHSLSLSGNYFNAFPSALQNLSVATLSYLDLGYNRISYVASDNFGVWSKALTTLGLRGNRIAQLLLDSFPPLPLRELVLSFNDLYYIEAGVFSNLTQLRILELSSAVFSGDISTGSGLRTLTWLGLDNNNIHYMSSEDILQFPSLEYLNLDFNKIIEFPSDLGNTQGSKQFHSLPWLRLLRLEGNRLRALPRDVFKNTLLEYLDLSNNQLSLFPSSALAQVGFTLRRLELSKNKIEYLDAAMFHATAFLHELGLAQNALTVLSDNTLAGLPRLRRLDLSFNAIKTNFKELFHNVPRLRRLSLANTGLKTAPHIPLANLTELNLSNNYITSYSEVDMKHFQNLRELDIAGNKFTTLRPAMWVAVPKLLSLDVSRNPIVRIQQGLFEGLQRLLYLKMDDLKYLETLEPRAFRALISLRSLTLETPAGEGRAVPITEIVSSSPYIEVLAVHVHKEIVDSQFSGMVAPKLRSLEVRGASIRTVTADAFSALSKQRALTLRLTGSSVAELPAGLILPLVRVPHLALDLTDNQLVSFGPSILYPNLTGWNRYATKVLPGGLLLGGNPLRCGCSASWVGGWLRRWTSEVGGGSRRARAAARHTTCLTPSGPRALLAVNADDAECHASALSSRSCTLAYRHVFYYMFLLVMTLYFFS